MKRFVFPVLLALSLLMGALPATTRAAEIIQFQSSGLGTYADFITSEGDCIITRVKIQAADQRLKQAGKPDTPTRVLIVITKTDTCAAQSLITAVDVVEVAPSAVQIDQQLNTATVQMTGVEIYDYDSDTLVPVDINMTWTATGDARRLKGALTERLGDLTISQRYDESYRPSAATGTVSLAGSANLTPEPTQRAKIESIRSNETVISR